MKKLKAILFDVDGTLADTERNGHRVAFNEAFAAAGLDWHWDEALYGKLLKVTGGKQRMKFFLDEFYGGVAPEGDIDALIAALHADKNLRYQALLESGRIPLRSGVARLLAEARANGIIVGIATTTTPGNVTALLRSTLGEQALGWFGVIAAGDVVPLLKPAPDVYVYAMQQLGLSAADCIAVEDSANGVRSARAAGLATVVSVNGYTEKENFDGAALVVDQLGEPDNAVRCLVGGPLPDGMVTLAALDALLA